MVKVIVLEHYLGCKKFVLEMQLMGLYNAVGSHSLMRHELGHSYSECRARLSSARLSYEPHQIG